MSSTSGCRGIRPSRSASVKTLCSLRPKSEPGGLHDDGDVRKDLPYDSMAAPGDDIADRVSRSGRSIYDALADRPDCFYDLVTLELRLDALLGGLNLDYPIRTRAKIAKSTIAEILGYPVPRTFAKSRPRFPGQNLDVYVQMANNFQVWNEEVDPSRRYAFVRVDPAGIVTAVRVLSGEAVALLDRTGTLTSKFQAKRRAGSTGSKLVSPSDTAEFVAALHPHPDVSPGVLSQLSPSVRPRPGIVLPIAAVARRLSQLVGVVIDDPGFVQERSRGIAFQRLACRALGLGSYADAGQFPDILSQVVEIKLQTSPTVDLGLVSPDSTEPAQEVGHGLRHCDARYAVAYGSRTGGSTIRVDAIVVATGADFFDEFQRFEGLVQNRKLQIPLPPDLFEPK